MTYCRAGEGAGTLISPDIPDNQAVNGDIIMGLVGEAVDFGDVLYLNPDGKFYKAAAVFGKNPAIVMAISPVPASRVTTLLLKGFARDDTWQFGTEMGYNLYLNATIPGELTGIAPNNDYNQIIGWLYMTNIIYFNPMY